MSIGIRGRFAVCVVLSVAIGCGGDDTATSDGGGSGSDGGRSDGGRTDGGARDAAGVDAMVDLCGGVECGGFEYCSMGACVSYPSCVSDTMCMDGEICRHRFCLPIDSDPDGDGSPAGEDCDETNPLINPMAMERCNNLDDDCNMIVDDGDPTLLCAMDPSGGECIDGSCGCPSGSFDIDRDPVNGCECMAMPALTEGLNCANAIDMGDLSDVGQTVTVSGNVLPDDREVWYRFRAIDTADTACDNYHVRAQLTTNPDAAYGLAVYRGDCATPDTDPSMLCVDYSWSTDLRQTIAGRLAGQCPCTARGATPVTNVSVCADDSAVYLVRVTRAPGSVVACNPYTLELTNGVYDTPP